MGKRGPAALREIGWMKNMTDDRGERFGLGFCGEHAPIVAPWTGATDRPKVLYAGPPRPASIILLFRATMKLRHLAFVFAALLTTALAMEQPSFHPKGM